VDLEERLKEAFKPQSKVHMQQPTNTPAAGYDLECSYMLPSCGGSAADIPWLPQEAADWLYNATHYAIPLLQTFLGTHKAFNAEGYYVDNNHTAASGGQLAAWRGTELGSRRERALIAYDRNVNFQAFVTPCCDFAQVWKAASQVLESFDLHCRIMVPDKHYRVCPKSPLAFDTWRESCHEARVSRPGMSRSEVINAAQAMMKNGTQPAAPIGPHYIDIGVSVIYPNSSVDVAACGAKCPATVKPHDLFPIVEGFYGPLRIPLPRTSAVLDLRFVKKWRTEAAVRSAALMGRTHEKKLRTEAAVMRSYTKLLPEDCMRAIHPAVPMKGCPKYLGCFRGASLDCSESDVIWRWL
jgi:hypothetical protein